MTVITSPQAHGGIKETNPFPSGGGADLSLLEIHNTSISSDLDPNTNLYFSIKIEVRFNNDENQLGSFLPM